MLDRDERRLKYLDEISEEDVRDFTERVLELLRDLKAEDPVAIQGLPNPAFSAIVIATLEAPVMIDSVADQLVDELGDLAFELFGVRARIEGIPEGGWTLIDFGEVLVNLFLPEVREYYSLERLWSLELLRAQHKSGSGDSDGAEPDRAD